MRWRGKRARQRLPRGARLTLADGRVKLWTMHRALQLRRGNMLCSAEASTYAGGIRGAPGTCDCVFTPRPGDGPKRCGGAAALRLQLMRGKVQLPLGETWGKDQLVFRFRRDAVSQCVSRMKQYCGRRRTWPLSTCLCCLSGGASWSAKSRGTRPFWIECNGPSPLREIFVNWGIYPEMATEAKDHLQFAPRDPHWGAERRLD